MWKKNSECLTEQQKYAALHLLTKQSARAAELVLLHVCRELWTLKDL